MPFTTLSATVECVDDVQSGEYNRLLDAATVKQKDWKSSETMLRADDLYRLGFVVDHNANPPVAGKGSCIFLHIWRGAGQGTAGCTAMEPQHMEELAAWLDAGSSPLLVQLPREAYEAAAPQWGLPPLSEVEAR
jgi:D-alanyl-D-alanine dipeptidase